MKKYLLLLIICLSFYIIGCGKKENAETLNNDITPTTFNESEPTVEVIPTEIPAKSNQFSGEAIIEQQSYTENGYYLSWFDDKDNLIIGYLPPEFVNEYNYPVGTKVKIDAVNDGSAKTETGKDAYMITSIEYLEDIDFTTSDDEGYTSEYEGVVYVEDQLIKDDITYLIFSFEDNPDIYYYGKIYNPVDDMKGNNYYFYIIYNEGELKDGKQYCEITGWEDYSYNIDFTDDNSGIETDSSNSNVFSPSIEVDYDSAYYSEDTGIWLIGNTMTNGKPFKINGIEQLYIQDGYLYFIGKISSTSSNDYRVNLNVTIRDKEGRNLNDFVSSYNYVFTYDNSLQLTREKPKDYLKGDGLKTENILPANGVGYFTFEGAGYESIYNEKTTIIHDGDAYINDVTNIRSWTVEPYYIYVTVNNYD